MQLQASGDQAQRRLRWAKASLQPLLEDPALGRKLAGNFAEYTLIIPIAKGGDSTVYQAIQTTRQDIPKIVALKVLAKDAREISGSDKYEFVEELRVMLKLKHPNIVKVFDFGEQDDAMFIVSEYVAGPSLRNVIDRLYPLALEGVKETLLELCSGLDALHQKGLIYRDMKPSNVICTNRDIDASGGLLVKIVDFGTVSPVAGRSGEEGAIIGTPLYMAPEQFGDAPYDKRVDIYALGMVAYEMVVGIHPFDGDDFMGIMRKHQFARLAPPSAMATLKPIPSNLDGIILKALAKSPKDRYQTAEEFADTIRRNWS